MRLPGFQFVEPKSIEEACLFLRDHSEESKIMGGGTDLLPSMKQGIFKPQYVLNLCTILELDLIEFDEQSGLRIGSAVKVRSMERDPRILESYPVIGQAAGEVGSVQLRHMGTVGGNLSLDTRCTYYNQSDFWRTCRPTCIKMGGEICNAVGGGKKCFAVFSGDLAPALIALGATIELRSAGDKRTLLLRDFYTGDGAKPFDIKPGEMVTHVDVPVVPRGAICTYLKYRIRKSIDFPLASVAAMFVMEGKERVCQEARMVIGAVGRRPEEVKEIGVLLKGKKIEGPLIEEAMEFVSRAAHPIGNTASTPSYRKRITKIFAERALRQAGGRFA